ncbi:glycoside hydrolase family 2 protein [Natronobiforma cellulositropha]|uniref:glycoside hydrolase family 2 n=1 Tax=Natronobiforma cellulositropha TaxID=1679076 RepID=UPI0021D59519|nr:glycoside hydrolase family 2 [Natronobiforma cellulositropha]
MAGKWTGGVVDSTNGDGPPTVAEWEPVAVPGRPALFADADGAVAYRTTFTDGRTSQSERARIQLRGAFGRTRVWLNGEYLGSHDAYFVPATFEFDPREENELLVCCAPTSRASPSDTEASSTHAPGIWWGVDLQLRPPTFIDSLTALPRVGDERAEIEVEMVVDAGEAVDDAVTLSLRPEGFRGGGSMERARVVADAGERVTVSKTLEVRDPKRWWPREEGPQHRYTVRAKLGDDTVERTVGLRTVERDDGGLRVNGRRVRAHGFLTGPSAGVETVERAVDANATVLRARGHVPPPDVYEACDEAGLLCWQDLPVAPDVSLEDGTALLESLVRTYGAHPSLATVGVVSDPVDPFEKPVGSGRLGRLRFRWRAWRASFERDTADAIAAAAPDSLPTIALTGAPGTDPDAVTLAPGWRYLEATDVDWLLERYSDLPASVTVEMGALAHAVGGETEARDALESRPGFNSTALERLESGLEESQASQARGLQTVVDRLRRRGTGVVVASALVDETPAGGLGVCAHDGTEKPAYGAVRAAFEPAQAVLDGPPRPGSTVGVTFCNDRSVPVQTTVVWHAGDQSGETNVSLEAFERAAAGTVDIPPDATAVSLESTVGERTVRNDYLL